MIFLGLTGSNPAPVGSYPIHCIGAIPGHNLADHAGAIVRGLGGSAAMEQKLRVALLFGGRSAEHDVSLMSAVNVYRALVPARYEVVLIAVARTGEWMLSPVSDGRFPSQVPADGPLVTLLPGGGGRLLVASRAGAAI